MTTLRTGLIGSLAIFFSMVLNLGICAAQEYPSKPIRFIVPYGAGGAADISTRVIAPRLAAAFGQHVIVDNRPGGGTIIASTLLAKAVGDGYTLMNANVTFSANPALHSKLPYDSIKDFVPITLIDLMPNVLLVHPSIAATSISELIALVKAKPGKLNYASAGIGSANHLNMELLKSVTGINVVNIPYQGGAQAMTSIVGGETQLLFVTVPPALPHIRSGRVRVLAATSTKRIATLPEVPTISEAFLPGFDFHEWHGVLAPAGIPKEVVSRLNREINKILMVTEVRERLSSIGAEATGSTPEQMAQHVQSEVRKWKKVVKPVD
ncbi:MAG: tripartite tricarboxylate transporter substrate binding protein [Sulfuricaulis sp.]|uniref:tripartite tricarboxylate transporter substrate binding protein n=1 Tax=Sulfuricaulis sp. TaxID=2003553 RepID=UPI0034A315F5